MTNHPYFKLVLLFFVSWSIAIQLTAQSKFPQEIRYDSLLALSRQQDKPIFMAIHQRNDFSPLKSISKKTKAILSAQFVAGSVRLDANDISHPLRKSYHLTTPIYLFTDSEGFPLLRYNKPITTDKTLVHLMDSAQSIAKGETMGKLMQQYKKGMRSQPLLRNLLSLYQIFDQYTDQQVLNDYLSQLTIGELNNFETVTFLLSCGPVYNSKTYLLARTNQKMVDSLYAILPLPKRKEINGRIIRRTFREALNKKDYMLSQKLGNYAAGTWQSHYLRARMSRSVYPLKYRLLSGDTSAYIQMARSYYNSFYYRVDPDSIAKLDFAYDRGIKIPSFSEKIVLDSVENIHFQQWVKKNRNKYKEDQARHLSYGARQLLAFGVNDSNLLFEAIQWQQKAIALRPKRGQYHHTLAQLLYRVGLYAEAEAQQKQAIEFYKPNKQYHKKMQEALGQLQARSW